MGELKMSWSELENVSEKKEETKPSIEFKSLSEAEEKRGLKILSYGNFSTGKTHFALSSTAPIYVIDTENGASPLANKFPNVKVLKICEQAGENTDEKDEVLNFEKYQDAINYLISVPDNEIGTIVIDSFTDVWSWCQAYAKTKVFKIPIEDRFKQQFDWGVPNGLMRKTLLKLINKNCNIILTAREGDVYDGPGKPSDRVKPQVQKKVPFFVDIILYHEFKFIKSNQINFIAKIEKCRQNGSIIGTIIESPTIDKIQELIKNGK